MMTHFRFGPEVVVETWFTPHSTQNHRLSDEKNMNYTLKMLTSGFIAKKTIQPEVVLETWFTPHSMRNHRLSDEKNRNYTFKIRTSD